VRLDKAELVGDVAADPESPVCLGYDWYYDQDYLVDALLETHGADIESVPEFVFDGLI
jgi:hypothetical protein